MKGRFSVLQLVRSVRFEKVIGQLLWERESENYYYYEYYDYDDDDDDDDYY